MFVALGIQHALRMHHILLSFVALSNSAIFFNIIS